jgi:hypothetical protein
MGSRACARRGPKSRAGFAAMPVGPPSPRMHTKTKKPIHMPAAGAQHKSSGRDGSEQASAGKNWGKLPGMNTQ